MIHHISRLRYDKLAWQVEAVRDVLTSHVHWLASHSVCLNVDVLQTHWTDLSFDDWYDSLEQLGLDQTKEYRKLGELRERMVRHYAELENTVQDRQWSQRFFLIHQHFFDLLTEFCQNFHMVFNMYDYLTHLPNRKLFDLMVDKANMNGALVMADIDHFKKINDQHGHEVGDRVLEKISRYFLNELKPGEVVARYGGEEFIFYFPAMPPTCAHEKIEQIREGVQMLDFGECCQTCSFGISQVDNECVPYKQALCRADKALYHAKNTGRNRTVVYEVEWRDAAGHEA